MTTAIERRITVDQHAAAVYVRRHPAQIRRRCTPIGTDPATGAALYDLDTVVDAFRNVPRRVRLT